MRIAYLYESVDDDCNEKLWIELKNSNNKGRNQVENTIGKFDFISFAYHFYCQMSMFYVNPLLHEFHFALIFEMQPKIATHRLPTHRRGAHRKLLQ